MGEPDFFVTAAGFLAGAAVGSVMGYGVGIVGGAIGAAMAQGINGGWDYKSGKQLGETSAAIGGFIGGFFENRDVSDGKTETVKTEGHKEEYLFNKKGQSLWQDGQRQKLVSKYVIKAEQVNTWPRISSTSYAVRWNNEIGLDKFWLKDVFAGNVTQDQMTKAYGRTQPQPQ